MTFDFDVCVVGGGIIGASIAAQLCNLGIRTALVERGACGGMGASGCTGGVVRLYDPDPVRMSLAARTLRLLGTSEVGRIFADSITHTGVIYRVAPEAQERIAVAALAPLPSGYAVCRIDDDEVRTLCPLIGDAGARANLFEPLAGLSDARFAIRQLVSIVRRAGTLLEFAAVDAIEELSDGSVALRIGKLTLRGRVVVLAAGAWAARFLPNWPLEARTIPLVRMATPFAMGAAVIDDSVGAYALPLAPHVVGVGSGIRHGARRPEELPSSGQEQADDAADRLSRLSGRQENGPAIDVLPGFDCYSPDGRPLVGFINGASGIYVATGMSGVGYKFAPAVAEIAADSIIRRLKGADEPVDPDADSLSPARFELGVGNCALEAVQP